MEVELRTAVDEQRERLCARFVDALFVSGASITVFGHQNRQTLVCASSPAASLNSTLQRQLHEGPHWDAYRSGVPTLCPSLPDADPLLWPAFADAAVNRGIIAVFAFPMRLGAAVVGVVDLHARRSRRLDAHQISMASSMANRFAATAEALAAESSALEPALLARVSSPMPREVHQATGIVQSQLNTTATDAFARLRQHASLSGLGLDEVARAVVDHTLNFTALAP